MSSCCLSVYPRLTFARRLMRSPSCLYVPLNFLVSYEVRLIKAKEDTRSSQNFLYII
jgi:hypothetical protein